MRIKLNSIKNDLSDTHKKNPCFVTKIGPINNITPQVQTQGKKVHTKKRKVHYFYVSKLINSSSGIVERKEYPRNIQDMNVMLLENKSRYLLWYSSGKIAQYLQDLQPVVSVSSLNRLMQGSLLKLSLFHF